MSASREKKLRQDSGPSAREAQARKEADAYRKKVITYSIIGGVIAVLIAALLIWNSGFFQSRTPAATVNGTTYSINDLSYFYEQTKYNSNYFYYYYGLSQYIPDDSDVQDESTGATWRDSYLEDALDGLVELTALYDAAVKAGYKESDVADTVNEQIASAKAAASSSGYSYGSYLKLRYGKFMGAGDFKSIVTRQSIANKYYTDHYESLTYTDEQLTAYYEENKDSLDVFEYSYLYFTPASVDTTDADGNELSEEQQTALKGVALAEAKTRADEALAALKGGKSVADAIQEYEPSSSSDHTTDLGSSVSSLYSEELFAMTAGGFELVENSESGYYVVALHARHRDDTPNADVRHILIKAETTTDADGNTVAPSDEAWAAARTKAQQVLDEYKAGAQTEDAFTELARKYSEDVDSDGNPNNDALYSNISPYDGYVTEFLDWIFQEGGHSVGDTGIVEHDGGTSGYSGCHVMYYAADNDPYWKSTADSALRSSDAGDWLDELEVGYSGSLESGAQYVGQ